MTATRLTGAEVFVCPSWCAYPDEHGRELFREDAKHMSEYRELPLSLEQPVETVYGERWQASRLSLILFQQVDAAEPIIDVQRDNDTVATLTMAELRQLAALAARLADEAEGVASC